MASVHGTRKSHKVLGESVPQCCAHLLFNVDAGAQRRTSSLNKPWTKQSKSEFTASLAVSALCCKRDREEGNLLFRSGYPVRSKIHCLCFSQKTEILDLFQYLVSKSEAANIPENEVCVFISEWVVLLLGTENDDKA